MAPFYFYRPQRSCEGYVFTGVCLSTGGSAGGCLLPGGECLLRRGVSALGVCVCSGGCLLCTEAAPPPGETVTAADGTHPTGMHSCYLLFYFILFFLLEKAGFYYFMHSTFAFKSVVC